MTESFEPNRQATQDLEVNFLFTDIDLAFTFLETARVTGLAETRTRCLNNAVKVHRDASAKIAVLVLPVGQRATLDTKLSELASLLLAQGQEI